LSVITSNASLANTGGISPSGVYLFW